MQAVRSVRDVRRPDVLGGREEIGRPRRDQRPERDLKGPGRDARGPPTPVEVDRIVPDPDGVIEAGGPSAGVERSGDVLLADRPPRAEAPAFATVRDLGEA